MSLRRERVAVVVGNRRRWPRLLLAAVVGLMLLFFVGGGWYFSSQIRSDALLVEAYEPEFEFEVIGSTGSTLTFELPSDPPADLTSGETLGIRWQGGYGQVGAVVSQTDTGIARSFTPIAGTRPSIGQSVALEGNAYPDYPSLAGFDLTTVKFETSFGEFKAWLSEGEASTWAIFVHGRGATRSEGLRILPALQERGIPTLLIEYRNDPEAPATDDHLARFGTTEWEDLEGAVLYAVEQGADDVILIGYSMGGAISLGFLGRSGFASEVRAVILDSPALELGAMVDAKAGDTRLPLLPMNVPMPLTATAKFVAGFRFDVDWGGMDYIDAAFDLSTPTLVIHGTEDETVPVELSRHFAVTHPELVTLEEFAGADHVRSWNVDPERYLRVVGAFLDELVAAGT